jgi:peroxiredoxin Q/BCP
MAMTPGCTAEGKALRDEYPAFQKLGVEVVGISFDAPEANAEFVAAHGFPYRLLSDDGSLAEKVGASEGPDDRTARRISYLIGPDGKVLRAYETVTPAEHATQVLTDVRGAKPQPSP